MRFESRENRLMWLGIAVDLLTDLGVSIAIVLVVSIMIDFGISIPVVDELAELGLVAVLVALVGIQIIKVLVWARGWIAEALIWRLYRREYLIDLFFDAMTKAELPNPPYDYQASAQNYFDSVIVNDSLDCQKRMEAAYWLAVLQFPVSMGRFWEGVNLDVVMGDAIVKYREHFDVED